MAELSDELVADLRMEIEALRRQNQTLGAKVQTMEMMYEMVMARPIEHYGVGQAEDVLWRLEKEMQEQA